MKQRIFSILLAFAAGFFTLPANSAEISNTKEIYSSVEYFDFQDKRYPGGLSGLFYLGEVNGKMHFLTHNDQGPHAIISHTILKWLEVEADSSSHTIQVVSETTLTDPKGKVLTGADLDTEGITIDEKGYRWMGEESIPSILKFDKNGRLLKRYIPKDSLTSSEFEVLDNSYGGGVLLEALPEHFSVKKTNRGFEGITFGSGKIYASLQGPVKTKETQEDTVRILEFDPELERTTREFAYPLNIQGAQKIGDIAYSAKDQNLYLIEQNSKTGTSGRHFLSKSSLVDEPMNPSQIADLSQPNYSFADKIEGLAMVSDGVFAFINDNDFRPEKPTVLGILQIH